MVFTNPPDPSVDVASKVMACVVILFGLFTIVHMVITQ